jgi:hypothetical protein
MPSLTVPTSRARLPVSLRRPDRFSGKGPALRGPSGLQVMAVRAARPCSDVCEECSEAHVEGSHMRPGATGFPGRSSSVPVRGRGPGRGPPMGLQCCSTCPPGPGRPARSGYERGHGSMAAPRLRLSLQPRHRSSSRARKNTPSSISSVNFLVLVFCCHNRTLLRRRTDRSDQGNLWVSDKVLHLNVRDGAVQTHQGAGPSSRRSAGSGPRYLPGLGHRPAHRRPCPTTGLQVTPAPRRSSGCGGCSPTAQQKPKSEDGVSGRPQAWLGRVARLMTAERAAMELVCGVC